MCTTQQAIAFIRSHGHFAAETADGIVATSQAGWTVDAAAERGIPADDTWFEETHVFAVDNGNVSLHAVRAWLGY